MNFEDFKKELMNKIKSSGELKAAFDMLMPALSDTSELLDEFVILNQSFNAIERQFNKQLVSLEDYNVNKNRIINGLIAFIQGELTAQDLTLTATTTLNTQELPSLNTLIKEMGFKKGLGPAALVNCDRNEANTRFNKFFSAKGGTTPYQFYFILGNADQLPERFGERLIYTIKDEYIDEDDEAAFDFRQAEEQVKGVMVPRATIEKLPVKGKCEISKKSFKRYFDERFTLGETSLEDFIATKSKQLAFEYIAFLFEYKEEVWTEEILKYFEWLIETFRQNRADKPTFLFFFVIRTDGVDEAETMQREIEELVNRHAEASLMMPNLVSVPHSDILTWFKNKIYAQDLTKVEGVLTSYLSLNNLSQSTDPIEMRHIEDLQKSIYTASLTKT